MRTKEEMAAVLEAFVVTWKSKFGDRSAIIIAAGIPEEGGHDAYAARWAGPCLTAKGLIHHAIPELDRSIAFPEQIRNEVKGVCPKCKNAVPAGFYECNGDGSHLSTLNKTLSYRPASDIR